MSTAPERTLPDNESFSISPEIDDAISTALTAWYVFGATSGDEAEKANAKQAQYDLRRAILAALEPERALRERAERLRKIALSRGVSEAYTYSYDIKPGDLADDIPTATSSVQTPS